MFSASDCWVLFSVGFGRKGADLPEILANGDRINHAIISRDELENGINALLRNGLLRREEGVFARVEPLFAREKRRVQGRVDSLFAREKERVLGRGDERVMGREDGRIFAYKNDRFFATPKARQFYKKDRKFFEGPIEELFRFSEILAAMPCEHSAVKVYELSEVEYQAAVRAYTKN
jgi:hypothetical protein